MIRVICLVGAITAIAGLAACGGGSSPSPSPAPVTAPAPQYAANEVALVVDGWGRSINRAYVTVTVCRPGSSTSCATIDHVLLDTGSTGLRLFASSVSQLSLPAVLDATSANPLAECTRFVAGTTWSAVRSADVRLGGEVASYLPIAVIADPSAGAVPWQCQGATGETPANFDGNGIMGVSTMLQDSPWSATQSNFGDYFVCDTSGCSGVVVPLTAQVSNPVAIFAHDDNGIVISLPAIPADATTTMTGTLTFGIGTQANNQLPPAATVYPSVALSATVAGQTYAAALLDTGTAGVFFPASAAPDLQLTFCGGGSQYFCPSSPVTETASFVGHGSMTAGAPGTAGPAVSFQIASYGGGKAAMISGTAPMLPETALFGLPFFYGRQVFIGFENQPSGPFNAF